MIKIDNMRTELLIERLIEKKIGYNCSAYVYLNVTPGKISIKVFGLKMKEPLILEKELLKELGMEGFADLVVLMLTFS